MAAVGNNDRHVVGQEAQSRKTSDEHNSDIAEMMSNQESNAAISSNDMDNSVARGVTRKRNAEDYSLKSRKKGTAAITYKRIQQGLTPKRNLTQDQIERLEEIGF